MKNSVLLFCNLLLIVSLMFINISCNDKSNPPPPPPPPPGPVTAKRPVADAGPDQTIFLPQTTTFLFGVHSYDSLNLPLNYSWRLISGSSINIGSPNTNSTSIYTLNKGTYIFELMVSNASLSDYDTVIIKVSFPAYCQPNRTEIPVELTPLGTIPANQYPVEIIPAGNKLIMPGSSLNNSVINIYDIPTQTWNTIQLSTPRTGISIISTGNKIYFAGGIVYSAQNADLYTPLSVIDIYDITTNSWSVANLSEARGYCQSSIVENKIMFAGGLKENGSFSNKVDIYDLITNTWSSTQFPGVCRAIGAAVTAENKVFLCGGYSGWEDPTGWGYTLTNPTTIIDIYNNSSGQWSTTSMQTAKGNFSAATINDKLFLAGGIGNTYYTTFDVEIIDANSLASSNACLFQENYFSNNSNTVSQNGQYIFYGANNPVNKFDIYDPVANSWSIGVLPSGVFTGYHRINAITSLNNVIYVTIGNNLYKMNY